MGLNDNSCKLSPGSRKVRLFVSTALGVFLVAIGVLISVIDPMYYITYYCSRVGFGTYTLEAISVVSEEVYVSAYLYNVTNAQRFQQGLDHKLKLEEVGPFTYIEVRTNEFLDIDQDADVIRYSPNIHLKFLPEESVARPEDIYVTMPNIVMLGLASKTSNMNAFTRIGYNMLTDTMSSKAIVHTTAAEYLWGYDEPLVQLGHNLLPGFLHFDKMGLMDRIYDQKSRLVFEVSASRKDKFSIKTANHSRGLVNWGYNNPRTRTHCNTFKDVYEGIGYPPRLTPQHHIRLYRNAFCRIFDMEYHGHKQMYGVDCLQFKMRRDLFMVNDATECMCRNGICIDGLSDISQCFVGLPLVLSNAHFLHADPSLYERIDGMRPDEELHGSSFVIEPTIGLAMESRFSVQVNLFMRDVSSNREAKRFSNMVIPFFQLKIEQTKLPDKQISNLEKIFVIGPSAFLALEALFIAAGFILLAYSAILLYSNPSDLQEKPAYGKTRPSAEAPLVEKVAESAKNWKNLDS